MSTRQLMVLESLAHIRGAYAEMGSPSKAFAEPNPFAGLFYDIRRHAQWPELRFYQELFRAKEHQKAQQYCRAIEISYRSLHLLLEEEMTGVPKLPEDPTDLVKAVGTKLPSLACELLQRRREFCPNLKVSCAELTARAERGLQVCTECPMVVRYLDEGTQAGLNAEIAKDAVFALTTIAACCSALVRAKFDDAPAFRKTATNALASTFYLIGPRGMSLDDDPWCKNLLSCGDDRQVAERLEETLKTEGTAHVACFEDHWPKKPPVGRQERFSYPVVELVRQRYRLEPNLPREFIELLKHVHEFDNRHPWIAPLLALASGEWHLVYDKILDSHMLPDESQKPLKPLKEIIVKRCEKFLADPTAYFREHPQNHRPFETVYFQIRYLRSSKTDADDYRELHDELLTELSDTIDRMCQSKVKLERDMSVELGFPARNEATKNEDPKATKQEGENRRSSPASPPPSGPGPTRGDWRPQQRHRIDNQLLCLKNWNSYTPSVPREGRLSVKGGGFFLHWEGIGYAIDPGQNYVENLYAAGRNVGDIDVILLSHAHADHVADVSTLLMLRHEMCETGGKKRDPLPPPLVVCNATATRHLNEMLRDTANAHVLFLQWLPERHRTLDLRPDFATIAALPAHHTEFRAGEPTEAIGFSIELRPRGKDKKDNQAAMYRIVFTGDTAWHEALAEAYVHRDMKTILVANIGSVKFGMLAGVGRDHYYEKHLGLKGVCNAVFKAEPNLAIVSEIGEELRGYRVSIAAALGRAIATKVDKSGRRPVCPVCVPGARGLTVLLQSDGEHVRCNYPLARVKGELCGRLIPIADLASGEQMREDGDEIRYLCRRHMEM